MEIQMEKSLMEILPDGTIPSLHDLAVSPKETQAPDLQEVLDLIIRLVAPERIFLLNTYEQEQDKKKVYDLLIILSNSADRPHKEYVMLIEHISMRIHPIVVTVIKAGELYKKLEAGHIYFSRVCRAENLLFDHAADPLPLPESVPFEALILKAKRDFYAALSKGRAFLGGAHYYVDKAEKELAAFMLQQAAEQAYRGITKSLTGHELPSHELYALIKRCRRCAPELCSIFSRKNEEEKRLLLLLQKAYVNSRYKDNYEISEEDLILLLKRVSRLHFIATDAFCTRIKEAEEALCQL